GFIGPVVLPARNLRVEELLARLKEHIVGQDEGLHELAEAVIAGRSDAGWYMRPGPRGVFLFGGPTGVGKTETATVLARILDEGKAQDSEGNEIDFRRCLVVLTSNAGVSYHDPERGSVLLGRPSGKSEPATVTEASLSDALLATGLGQEFLGRVQHTILF